MEITANISLKNGRRISDKTLHKITAQSTKLCTGFYQGGVPVKNYYCRYSAKKEPDGYIFREVRFNTGICGHYPTIRRLVLNTILNFAPSIEVHISD